MSNVVKKSSITRVSSAAPAATADVKSTSLRLDLKQFTRQRLLDAALNSFTEFGYKESTVERIAEQAGTTVPTFYRHFSSKAELLDPLLDYLTTEVETVLLELDQLESPGLKAVRRWLDTYIVMWVRLHRLCAAHWEAADFDSSYGSRVIGDVIDCVSMMKNTLSRVPPEKHMKWKVRMGLMVLFADRMAAVVSCERSAARANAVREEFSKILLLILRNDLALDQQ